MIPPSNTPCNQQHSAAPDRSSFANSYTPSNFSLLTPSTRPSISQLNKNSKSAYWDAAILKSKELQQTIESHYNGAKNIKYTPDDTKVRLFRTKNVYSFAITTEGNTEGLFEVEIGKKKMNAYAFLYDEGYWYILIVCANDKDIISKSAKHYVGYENVTKGLLTKVSAKLYNSPTKIHHKHFPEAFKKYVNFAGTRNSNLVPDGTAELSEQLERYLSFILEWGINMTLAEMRNTFLNKVGYEHEAYVNDNKCAFERVCNVNRYGKERIMKNCDIEDQLTGLITFKGEETIDPKLFIATMNAKKFVRIDFKGLFRIYMGQNIYHYRRSGIKHIYIDGTGSLPAPFTQIINVSYFDHEECRHRYLCSLLLQDENLLIDRWMWRKILTSLRLYIKFESVSADNEFALLDALTTVGIQIWGCHAHYLRNISRFTSKRKSNIRQKFYALIKYFMFLPDHISIFARMENVIANAAEKELYKYVKKEYVNNNYFQYDEDTCSSREKAARITTSPLEGINGALKIKLRRDKSIVSIIQFIKEKSQQKLNLAKPISTYQRIDYTKIESGLREMEDTVDSEGKQTLMDQYVKRQPKMPKWKRMKLRADEYRRSGEMDKYNKCLMQRRAKYHRKMRIIQEHYHDKVKFCFVTAFQSIKEAAKRAKLRQEDYEFKVQTEKERLEYAANMEKFFEIEHSSI